jgi:hypothetical protein
VEIRLHPERDQAHGSLVQNQKGGQTGRSRKKGGIKKSKTGDVSGGNGDDPNRHGLSDVG